MGTKIPFGAADWQQTHVDLYLKTDGAEGHYVDFTPAGGTAETPCLILKVKGRKSGGTKLIPLIYGEDGASYVIVASKGGAPENPAWFLNLQADPNVAIQVGDRKLAVVAKVVAGEQRQTLYDMMSHVYAPYIEYQAKTPRQIPVVVLEPKGEIASL